MNVNIRDSVSITDCGGDREPPSSEHSSHCSSAQCRACLAWR